MVLKSKKLVNKYKPDLREIVFVLFSKITIRAAFG